MKTGSVPNVFRYLKNPDSTVKIFFIVDASLNCQNDQYHAESRVGIKDKDIIRNKHPAQLMFFFLVMF